MRKIIMICATLFLFGLLSTGTAHAKTITIGGEYNDDISAKLQEACDINKYNSETPLDIIIESGRYTIRENPVHVYSNTTITATGATILGKTDRMLIHQEIGDRKYNGFSDITIDGGTWYPSNNHTGSPFMFSHGTNLTIKNLSIIKGSCCHMIALSGINGCTIENCVLRDQNLTKYEQLHPERTTPKSYCEAIHIDILAGSSYNIGLDDDGYDGTMMKNLTIRGCTFKNLKQGIAAHTSLYKAYHSNIIIANNKFINMADAAICMLDFRGVTITKNVIDGAHRGIVYWFGNGTWSRENGYVYGNYKTKIKNGTETYNGTLHHCSSIPSLGIKSIISGNTLKNIKSNPEIDFAESYSIQVKGWIYKDTDNYIKELYIMNNTFSNVNKKTYYDNAKVGTYWYYKNKTYSSLTSLDKIN